MTLRTLVSALLIGSVLGGVNPPAALAFNQKAMSSVVSVLPNWLRWKQQSSDAKMPDAPEGTAIAILEGGYLMTNAHVLGTAKEVDIRLNDGKLLAVEIIGRDRATDLALLKAPIEFPVFEPAAESRLAENVCAIGNQFGLGLSVTCGVISAIHRTGTGFNVIEDFIQTDTVINPGGSGGALVNRDGQLVGMVSAIFTKESDSNIGINFAASTRLLARVATDLRDHGRVIWGRSGLRAGTLTTDERRKWSGAKIIHIEPGGAAEIAGLGKNDILIEIGGRPIIKPTDVKSVFGLHRPGDKIAIAFLRDGERSTTTLTLRP